MKFTPNLTYVAEEGKPPGVGKKGHRKASSKAATKRIRKIVAQAQEKDFSKRVTGPQSSIKPSCAGRKGRRKISSKTAATCIGKTVPWVQEEDASKGVLDPHSSTKLSGVAIGGRQSQVHIEHMKQSLKVVTTSPQLIPTQLAPASSQPVATSHHVCASSNTTGIAAPKVQLTALSSPIPTSSTPPAILPNLTTVPSQFVISSAPPLPFHYQIPTGYQLPIQLSLGSPPPLVPISANTRPAVGDPFAVCFVQGNISRCNGCKGRIRQGDDGKPLPPPDDLATHGVCDISKPQHCHFSTDTHTTECVLPSPEDMHCPSFPLL